MEGERKPHLNYKTQVVKWISVVLCCLGCLMFMAQTVDRIFLNLASVVVPGIWIGAILFITGVLGICSSEERTTCLIVSFLVMCIIGAVACVAGIVFTSIGLAAASDLNSWVFVGSGLDDHKLKASEAMNAIMLITSMVIAILLIVLSGFACHGLCCGGSSRNDVAIAGQIMYIPRDNGQPPYQSF